ncbi:MAG TPA: hypothetical protein VKF17_19340 [Isosphaeraceae bacterium]|nr:hypothetical protein [Isosphaeraceae bacterium]
MIHRFHVQNFKSIVDVDVDLSPVTVLVGKSGTGNYSDPAKPPLTPQAPAVPGYREGTGLGKLLGSSIVLFLALALMIVVLGWVLFRAGKQIKKLPVADV